MDTLNGVGHGSFCRTSSLPLLTNKSFRKTPVNPTQAHRGHNDSLNFILVGPLGQAAYAAQILGMATSSPGNMSFADYNRGTFVVGSAGQIISVVSILSGLLLWGHGAFWLLFSLATTVHLGFFTDGGVKTTQYSLYAWSAVFPCVRSVRSSYYFW